MTAKTRPAWSLAACAVAVFAVFGGRPVAAAPGASLGQFCEAKAQFDALDSETPDERALASYVQGAVTAMTRVEATAPPTLKAPTRTVLTTLQGMRNLKVATAAHSNVAYLNARAQLASAVHDKCAYHRVAIRISDVAMTITPATSPIGKTSILVTSKGKEPHVVVIAMLRNGVTAEQLLAEPDSFEANATAIGAVFLAPGLNDGVALTLKAGRYVTFDPEHLEELHGKFTIR